MSYLNKNTIVKAVRNGELVRALDERERLANIRERLAEAVRTMEEFGVDRSAIGAAREKFDEYTKITNAYGAFIEDAFGVTWHYWRVILKYRDASDEKLDGTSVEEFTRAA